MEIDIRYNKAEPVIDTIRFGSAVGDVVTRSHNDMSINISAEYNGGVHISDIDNLIFALQKAKELWE